MGCSGSKEETTAQSTTVKQVPVSETQGIATVSALTRDSVSRDSTAGVELQETRQAAAAAAMAAAAARESAELRIKIAELEVEAAAAASLRTRVAELEAKVKASSGPPLPEGWKEVPHGAEVYFWNETTGETSWERPLAPLLAKKDRSANGPAAAEAIKIVKAAEPEVAATEPDGEPTPLRKLSSETLGSTNVIPEVLQSLKIESLAVVPCKGIKTSPERFDLLATESQVFQFVGPPDLLAAAQQAGVGGTTKLTAISTVLSPIALVNLPPAVREVANIPKNATHCARSARAEPKHLHRPQTPTQRAHRVARDRRAAHSARRLLTHLLCQSHSSTQLPAPRRRRRRRARPSSRCCSMAATPTSTRTSLPTCSSSTRSRGRALASRLTGPTGCMPRRSKRW